MKNILVLNLKQAFFNKRFLLIILLSIILSFCHYYFNVYIYTMDKWYDKEFLRLSYKWIGFQSVGSFLFLLMPLISVFVFSDSYLLEQKNGFLNGIYTRVSKGKYLFSKYISVFIIGGISFILPLLISLVIVSLTVSTEPASNPNSGLTPISLNHMFSGLYFSSPILYCCLYLFIDFLFAGVFAVLALSISIFIKKVFVVLLIPFLINIILSIVLEPIIPQIVPTYLVDPQQPILYNKPIYLVVEFLLFLLISLFFYFWGIKKYEQI
ncbi:MULTISPECIES: ABC transporter permease [Bacillus cereus group]|uniref:ABC transporter permease n=1 Tax=Bacillus cereus group TaxID=86661 RepID=UPI00016B8840|nr:MULTISPECIES: ABC transporter permease [Bacillus cereus group]ACI30495.1 conserved hypothetical protein [Bacillus cereus H3081.97]KLA01555.1 hypothetical protein B4086_5837 [Bacillus cereus]HDR7898752.1 ABC transporter permease [Bacillus pacificus]MDA1625951.1 ABC transporter permease [Bacillus cereus group sp. TH206-1LC]MDA1899052.1 ABC transporter permease [Bacillus cereus group sp. BcHK28]